MSMQFINLHAQRQRIQSQLDATISQVINSGAYIMGPAIATLEETLAEYTGVKHAITCSSGSIAMLLGLRTLGMHSADAVIVPSFTFAASPEVIALLAAVPVFADVRKDTFNIDPQGLEAAKQGAEAAGLKVKGLMAVDLFGQSAEHDALVAFAKKHGLWVLDDAAQAFGAKWDNVRLGQCTEITTTSFFPAKPLGCYGDGGALLTNSTKLAELIKSYREHGQGHDRNEYLRCGITGRMDTLQAAILLEKMRIFEDELETRDRIATRYSQLLGEIVTTPYVLPQASSTWAQYTILLPEGANRERIRQSMHKAGVPTAVYYAVPMHAQPAYKHFPIAKGGLPNTEWLADRVLSLPMHAYLTPQEQDTVVESLKNALLG